MKGCSWLDISQLDEHERQGTKKALHRVRLKLLTVRVL